MNTIKLVSAFILVFIFIPSFSDAATLTFRNNSWREGVRVEVRIGDFVTPEQNPLYGSQSIGFGQSWSVSTKGTTTIWYRWGNDLGSLFGKNTSWTRKMVYEDNHYDVTP
jgi:hypothetical protein